LISEIISLGLAGSLRRRAIRQLEDFRRDWILDSGAGPGTSSRMMLEDGFEKIAGLDPSRILLQHAKASLGPCFHPVIGTAENLPFRSDAFSGVLTCFSYRDVRDKILSLREFARVVDRNGRLEIVDVGKPDGMIRQKLIESYVALVMPTIARFLIAGRIRGNPFQMIVTTFHRLATNRKVVRLAESEFGSACIQEFLLGGLVVIAAERTRRLVEK
jgi:ubiquinone/menaquinone biosynthesis C-methylase UbiE